MSRVLRPWCESFFVNKILKSRQNLTLGIITTPNTSTIQTITIQNTIMLSHAMSSRGPVTNASLRTGTHYPLTTRSVMVDVRYTASAGQSSIGPAGNSASLISSPCGPSPFRDLNHSEHGVDSNDQTELSRYRRLYTQAREDLNKLNGQVKRRFIQTVPPPICTHRNKFLGKLLVGHNWDAAYASSSPCLMIYQQSSTSMTYTASYVMA